MKRPESSKVRISFDLDGDQAARFLAYKEAQFIHNSAEAARKLMLERLHEVRPVAAETTPHQARRVEQ